MPGSEPLETRGRQVSVADFVQDHPNVPQEELGLFVKEYNMTSHGFLNGVTEDAYQILYGSIHLGYDHDELVERLTILRDRARLFAEMNQNPDRDRDFTGAELVEIEQEIYRLTQKNLDGTITESEYDRLKAL